MQYEDNMNYIEKRLKEKRDKFFSDFYANVYNYDENLGMAIIIMA